jgi:hypothetical protein
MEEITYSPEESQKRFENSPQEIKNMLYSIEMLDAMRQIGEKFKLHIDQVGLLQVETTSVMLGFTSSDDFDSTIANTLRIEPSQATLIAQDVDQMLFSKIRNSMKQVYEANKTPAPITSAPVMPPTPPATPMMKASPAVTAPYPPMPDAPAPVAVAISSSPSVTPAATTTTPVPQAPVSAPPMPKPPLTASSMAQAETVLSQKTVDTGPAIPKAPPIPPSYKTDPYREPAE